MGSYRQNKNRLRGWQPLRGEYLPSALQINYLLHNPLRPQLAQLLRTSNRMD